MVGVDITTTVNNSVTLASKMIDQAESEINKYLSKRYDITADRFQTSTSIPPMVRTWAEDLSEGKHWQRLSRGGAGEKSVERGQKLIDGALKNLELIADYKLDLLDTLGAVIVDMSNTAYNVLSNTKDYTPTFAEDDPLVWVSDPDKLSDISDSRD